MLQQGAINFGRLFQGAVYRIPEYQRSYSWVTKQLNDLWSDLWEIMKSSGATKHFMGTLVLKPGESIRKHAKSFELWEVIDGQQRLTTLTVLMACIARRLREDVDLVVEAENMYDQFVVYCRNGIVDPTLQKLVIGSDDNPFFWSTILQSNPVIASPGTPGQRRLYEARALFEQKLKALSADDLLRLRDIIDDRLLFLTYTVGSELEAGLVFETINDRGKNLSNLDKIKNYLMYLAAKQQSDSLSRAVSDHWGNLLRRVSELDPADSEKLEDTLVRYHWIMETGNEKEYEVYRGVKLEYPVSNPGSVASAEQYVNRLSEAANLYVKIKQPDESDLFLTTGPAVRKEIVYYLLSLQRLKLEALFAPLLIASLRKFAADPGSFKEIARSCYLFAWRAQKVCRRRSDAGSAKFASLAHGVMHKSLPAAEVVSAIKELLNQYGGDQDFRYDLANVSGDELKFLLHEWEVSKAQAMRQDALPWEVIVDYQIEHIWPQTPKEFAKWGNTLITMHEGVVDQLGNKTLVPSPWNPKLSNRSFTVKSDTYQNSTLLITRELAQDPMYIKVSDLEKAAASATKVLEGVSNFVESRGETIIEFAMERWKI